MSKSTDEKSARKYWWIIMILPIGLVVGSITSVVHHLRQNEEKESQKEFQVAVALNADDIESAMTLSLLIGKRNITTEMGRNNIQAVNRFIQGAVSPGGIGLQFTGVNITTNGQKKLSLAYTDIEGDKKNEFVVLVIELIGEKGKSDAAKIGLSPSLIRSLAGDKPLYSLRFVLSPETLSASQHAQSLRKHTLSSRKQILHKVIVLKEQDVVNITDPNDWKISAASPTQHASKSEQSSIEITHPILLMEDTNEISPEFSKATLKATDQLRLLLLKFASTKDKG
jgi:hypothetical protein